MIRLKKIIFIASTGGHLAELLQLSPLFKKCDYRIVTENIEYSHFTLDRYPGKVDLLVYGTKKNMLTYPFKFIYNSIKSFKIFLKFKPDYIITTGAHTCVPMCYIAKLFRKKVIYIETMANLSSKTVTGKLIYPIADLFIVQWESMLKMYPKAKYGGWVY